jgi:hypothetical protein
MFIYRSLEHGVAARNVLIVGTGRVGQAMRRHLNSIRHLGYNFKGFVAYRKWSPTVCLWRTMCLAP